MQTAVHISEVYTRNQKPCQSSRWHGKCIFMPLNVLSTPIPFSIRNGIIWTFATNTCQLSYRLYQEIYRPGTTISDASNLCTAVGGDQTNNSGAKHQL